jgi:transcriptional regulator with XRE-family HTH domain
VPAPYACPACRVGVLARRGDPLCPACTTASREMPQRPLWLFDSMPLRQALAQVNLSAVPAIIRAACGLSQRDLAAVAGWSQAVLSYYERGTREGMYDIRTALRFADSVGMPRTALLPLVAGAAALDVGTLDGTRAELSRRGRAGLATADGMAAALPPMSVPRRPNGSHIRYWQACADALYARDRSVGGTVLLPLALQQWRRARLAVRGSADDETGGSQLLGAAAELALCTGWLALDAGRLPLAQLLHEEATELATGSGDEMTVVHVLTSKSMLHAGLVRTSPTREPARKALLLAFQAQEQARYIPLPKLHALIALRHASPASLLGDRTAFQAAITRAHRELDRGPQDCDAPQWLQFVDHTEITGSEARGWLNLGDASRSTLLYRQALASVQGARNRARFGAGLAGALLKQGAYQDAIAAAMQVTAEFGDGVTSMRCLNRLRLIRQAAGNTPGAREFRDRFDAIERSLAASCVLPGDDESDIQAEVPA